MGYLIIDHREGWSDLPREARAQLGEKVVEYDTVTCPHCNRIMKIVKGQTSGYWCGNCWAPICEGCAEDFYKSSCLSMQQRMDLALARANRTMQERIDLELARAKFLTSVG